jgi:hypothetical protein
MTSTTTTTIAKATAQPVVFCASCGAMVPTAAKFCNACGEPLAPIAPRLAAVPIDVQPEVADSEPVAAPPGRRLPRKRIAIAAVVIAALGGAGTVVALRPADNSAEQARASLRASNAGVTQIVGQLRRADRLGDLRSSGRAAQRQQEALVAEAGRLETIQGKDAGRKALAVIAAERQLLGSIAALGHLDPAHVGDWPRLRAGIDAAGTRLIVSARDVESLGPAATLAPSGSAVAAALGADDDVVTRASVKLGTWRRAYRRARRAQHRHLAALTAYASAVNAQLGTYNGLRDDLDQWIADIGVSTIPYGQAFEELTAAADRRKDVRDALANLNPPHRLAATHTALLAVLSDAIVAMTDAGDAAQECTADPTCLGDDFRDMPQWQSFSDASRRISGQFAAADQRWQQAVTQMRSSVRDRRMPAPPTV